MSASGRPPWSEFRAALEAAGFRPSKTRGQNFLLDTNCARSIARDAQVGPRDVVLEVGPGCGFLSVHLAELGVDLVAVEIDPRLAAIARRFLEPFPNVRLIEGDVLAGKHAVAPSVLAALPEREPWHVVANLPYAITGPLLASLARLPNPPLSMTVLVQREVAERLAARPGRKAWGGLTARLALSYQARRLRDVGAQLFWPRPRVESAVVRLELLPEIELRPSEVEAYDRLVELLFGQRRKTLRAILRTQVDPERLAGILGAVGVEPRARPEELGARRLLALVRALEWAAGPENGTSER